ncbi:MAG: hypothetical protein NC299_10300 [Lachnospiraceae bacterium]|nr:hypothetical protein [Ruminococcus sp.]MCM1275738.1 hypothetical protein [Lachnospiraceae bacterium]
MKFDFKRTAAGALALALTAALCGCDNGYLMTVDEMSIRSGIYLSFQQSAYNEAYEKISEESGDDSSSTSEVDVFAQTIEGKSASEWIKEQTLDEVRKFVAVQRLCEEKGIALSDEELSEINSDIKSTWDEENFYVQYMYGFNTAGEYYESLGVGIESLREIRKANELSDKLFLRYFGSDGETPVTTEELNEHLTENYAVMKYISIAYADDDAKAQANEAAEAYAERLNGGESFIDVKYDADLNAAQKAALSAAQSSYTEDNEEGLTEEEYCQKAVDEATAEKAESLDDLDTFVPKENSSLDEKLTEYVWNAADDGKAAVFEGESYIYVVVREDITTKSGWIEENNLSLLKAIKSDEYDGLIELTYQNYDVDLDEYLVNKKYAPEKTLK